MPPVTVLDYSTYLEKLKEMQSSIFDKASTYTTLIMGLGYGGFFAAWSGAKEYLLPLELVISAFLVTISLFVYLLFEI